MAAVERNKADPIVARLRGVSKQYRRGAEVVPVLEKLDLELPRGDFVALMGPSGSGKTTLLNLLGGLDRPTTGSIEVDGLAIDRLSDGQLGKWRADNVGFVFQMYNLLPVLTAERNVELPLLLTRLGRADRLKRVHTALSLVGLGDRMKHKPRELSGGQEQRVGIARAIVTDPTLLALRRADRRPRPQIGRRSPRPAAGAQQATRQDHRHGHARSARCARANRTLHLEKGRLERESS